MNNQVDFTKLMEGYLSKRELFAAMAMQSLIAKIPLHDTKGEHGIKSTSEQNLEIARGVAGSAACYADALIAELAKEKS